MPPALVTSTKRLYYMTSLHWAEVILHERRLKLSTIPELNDPFELLAASVGHHMMRRIMRALYDHWSRTKGIICFSDNWKSPLMWAHYADKHNGVCLGFDLVQDHMQLVYPVSYSPDRLLRTLDHSKALLGIDEAFIYDCLTTKFRDWSYEREFRVFADLTDQEANGLYYVDFGHALRLKEVIVGARCSSTVESMATTVGQSEYAVQILKARPAFQTFEIVRQKQAPIITIGER